MFTHHPTDPNRQDVVILNKGEFQDGPGGRCYRVVHAWTTDLGRTWNYEFWGASPGYLAPPASIGWDHANNLWIMGVGVDGLIHACSGQTATAGDWYVGWSGTGQAADDPTIPTPAPSGTATLVPHRHSTDTGTAS